MRPLLNISNITLFVSLMFLYYMQGILYASGSAISQGILLLLIMMGGKACLNSLSFNSNKKFVYIFFIFFLLQILTFLVSDKVVYGYAYEAIGRTSTFGQFKHICVFTLTFFFAYNHSYRKAINDKYLGILCIVFLFLGVIIYLSRYNEVEDASSGFTNNASYFLINVLPLFPFLLKKNKLLFSLTFVLLVILIILAAKRGAIVCLVAAFFFSLFYYLSKNRLNFKRFSLIVMFSLLAIFFFINILYSNDYLLQRIARMDEVGIGPREIAYKVLWQHWLNESSIFKIFFGNGIAQTVTIWGNYAHNDWFELLINNGLLGIFLYFILFISFYFSILKLNADFNFKLAAHLCLLLWFLRTIFSMTYTNLDSSFLVFELGIILGTNAYNSYNTVKR